MSYDGVLTYAMTKQLQDELLLGKIEKVYQPQQEQLLISVHTKNGRRKLFISSSGNHSAMYLVEDTPENPVQPPVFCMVLRKQIQGGRITDIEQHENERIIEISIETVDELQFSVNRKLIVELMGKHSNILLVDTQTEKIIDSIKHIGIDVNRARQILPGKKYEYPPAQNKIPFTQVTESDMEEMVRGQLQPERSIMAGIQGVSPVLAQSIASSAADEIDGSVSGYAAYDCLQNIMASIDNGSCQPVVYLDSDDKPADFHITPLSIYEEDPSYRPLQFETVSQAAAYFFVNRESSNTIKQKSNDLQRVLNSHLQKLRLKTQRLNEDLIKAENADKYRLYGELLTANLHLAKPGDRSVTVINYYNNEPLEIPLDPKYPPSRNAQNYYKKYGKYKTAVKEKKLQLEETAADIDYLETVSSFAERAQSIEEIDLIRQELVDGGYIRHRKQRGYKKKDKPKPYSYTLSSGRHVMAGRNNKENDWLTLKKASGTDLWFHTKDIPGSHVILFLEGGEPTEEELFEAAAIAAYHSKGAASSNVPVDYTKVRYVKKPAGAKPGMVIFTHNRTLYVNPKLPQN